VQPASRRWRWLGRSIQTLSPTGFLRRSTHGRY